MNSTVCGSQSSELDSVCPEVKGGAAREVPGKGVKLLISSCPWAQPSFLIVSNLEDIIYCISSIVAGWTSGNSLGMRKFMAQFDSSSVFQCYSYDKKKNNVEIEMN